MVWFEVEGNKLPSWDTSGCECKPGRAQPPMKYRAAGSRSGSDIKRRRVVAVVMENFDLATTPALRATPPVPGGEPEFRTRPLLCTTARMRGRETNLEDD